MAFNYASQKGYTCTLDCIYSRTLLSVRGQESDQGERRLSFTSFRVSNELMLVCLLIWPAVKVSCGAFHTAAVSSDGCLFTWGDGLCGKLGHGNHDTCTEPRQVMTWIWENGRKICWQEQVLQDFNVRLWRLGTCIKQNLKFTLVKSPQFKRPSPVHGGASTIRLGSWDAGRELEGQKGDASCLWGLAHSCHCCSKATGPQFSR